MQWHPTGPSSGSRSEAVAGAQDVTIAVADGRRVSGLFQRATNPQACYVLAHGAGAGMRHPFLAEVAERLAQCGITTLRYQFPYMEAGSRRVDAPSVAQATVRAAVAEATRLASGVALFAGGKSFGGRMTSQAQAESPMDGVRGLIFLGFPLHPPGRPSVERGKHLSEVQIPMLFLQGSRDEFANQELLEPMIEELGRRATLKLFTGADHSFRVPKRAGQSEAEMRAEMCETVARWIRSILQQ